MKKAFPNVYISHFAALGVFFCEESVQLTAATVTRRKGQWKFAVHRRRERRVNDSGRCAFHCRWKAWLERQQISLQCKDGVHFQNRDNNKRPQQRRADMSRLPNEAWENHARIKRPLETTHTGFHFWLPAPPNAPLELWRQQWRHPERKIKSVKERYGSQSSLCEADITHTCVWV